MILKFIIQKTFASYYNDEEGFADHGVCLVGWNDTFSKENFLNKPPADGAWIIKNSWGSDWGDKGFFYVSYYDTSFGKDTMVAFTIDDTNNYERNYQYDYIGVTQYIYKPAELSNISYYNIYTIAENELVSAVGTYFDGPNVDYTITITREDNDTYVQSGKPTHNGFETNKLNNTFVVKQNQTVTVKITSNAAPIFAYSRLKYGKNVTFVEKNGTVEDLQDSGKIARIKMYTVTDYSKIEAENLTTKYNSTEYLKATFHNEKGEKLINTSVEFIINNKTYTKKTDYDGIATLDEQLNAANYTVTIVNPIGQNKMDVNLIILPTEDNNSRPVEDNDTNSQAENKTTPQKTIKSYPQKTSYKHNRQTSQKQYNICVDNNSITNTNAITIETLNIIFNQTFTNGYLLVYIDGQLVYNATTTDDIYTVILEITSKLLGQHELKIEFTDNNNNTQTYIKNITIN